MAVEILIGDALEQLRGLPAESVHAVCTSPPYWGLRCYGVEGQLGLEPTPEEHIANMVDIFREIRRVLRKDGVCWMNYGDAYASSVNGRSAADTKALSDDDRTFRDKPFSTVGGHCKPKDLLMMPARVALALQADGWWLRSMMPWVKRNPMPESAQDRPGTAIEYVFMMTKSARYFYDTEAVRVGSDWGGVTKKTDGWATHAGGHGSFHKDGREKGATNQVNGGSRNLRNSDLFYASLQPPHGLIYADDPLALDVNPAGFSDAHFATFPPKLIEPLIKAATSEKGCCAECGAPWVREVDRAFTQSGGERDNVTGQANMQGWEGIPRGTTNTKTLGWSPSCKCRREPWDGDKSSWPPNRCVVLDPFGGAGTTGLVADRLGRDAILIDLNPEYAQMARDRIDTDAATRGTGPEDVMRGDDLPLFSAEGD